MSNTSETPISYKGWTIAKETEPWSIKYGHNFVYFQDEHVRGAATIEEAKSEIDERIAEQESKNPNPYRHHIIVVENKIIALDNAIRQCLLVGYETTASELIQIRDDFKQQLSDLEIDANALPFPQK